MDAVWNFIAWIDSQYILWMFVVFTLILITTYWPGRKSRFENDGRMIFDDDKEVRRAHQD